MQNDSPANPANFYLLVLQRVDVRHSQAEHGRPQIAHHGPHIGSCEPCLRHASHAPLLVLLGWGGVWGPAHHTKKRRGCQSQIPQNVRRRVDFRTYLPKQREQLAKHRERRVEKEVEREIRGRHSYGRTRMVMAANENDSGDQDGVGSTKAPTSDTSPPPEFNACFSSSSSAASATFAVSSVPARRNMRWGLWSSQDKSWMQVVQQNYEKHHRTPRPRPPAGAATEGV